MYVIVYLFTQSALKFWTRSRKNRGRCMVNISALCGNYFRLLRRFFPAANRAAPAGWTWSGRGQEIPLWFHRPHFWNLHDPRIKMIYNMSMFSLFQFFGPYNLGWSRDFLEVFEFLTWIYWKLNCWFNKIEFWLMDRWRRGRRVCLLKKIAFLQNQGQSK